MGLLCAMANVVRDRGSQLRVVRTTVIDDQLMSWLSERLFVSPLIDLSTAAEGAADAAVSCRPESLHTRAHSSILSVSLCHCILLPTAPVSKLPTHDYSTVLPPLLRW